MKHLLYLILLAMLSLTAMAQEPTFEKSYFRASIGGSGIYMMTDVSGSHGCDSDSLFGGAAAGVYLGWRLSNSKYRHCAVYFETGVEAQYGVCNKGNNNNKAQILSLTVPLDLVYKFNVSGSPYYLSRRFILSLGASPKYNALAKIDYDVKYQKQIATIYYGHKVNKTYYENERKTIDLFDEDSVGEGCTSERFQIGANVGIGYESGRWQIAYKFTYDFMPFESYSYQNTDYRTQTMSHIISLSYILH